MDLNHYIFSTFLILNLHFMLSWREVSGHPTDWEENKPSIETENSP